MVSLVLLVCLACSTSGATPQDRGFYVSVKEVLQTLATGTLAEREQMMSRVITVEATAKSHEIARAVAAELARMSQVTAERQRRIAQGILDPDAPGIGEYKGLLVQACAQSNDPVVIDALIGVIDTGNMAMNALVRFGALAFDRVVAVAADGEKASKVSAALATLTKFVRAGPLSPVQSSRVLAIARSRTQGTQVAIVWREAMDLAIATGDVELRARVTGIASGAIEPSVADREDMRAWLRNAARGALAARSPR